MRVRHQLARLPEIGCALHEAQPDHVDAERKTELEVLDVLRGNRRTRQRHAGCIDPFVLADLASFDDRRLNLGAVAGVDAQLDDAVGEQEAIAGTRVLGQPGERSRQPSGPTDEITRGDPQGIAGVDVQRAAVFQHARADLRPAEVLQDRHHAACPFARRADAREGRAVRLVRPV